MSQQTVAIIGAGVIGCGWSAYYAERGLQVRVFDVRAGYERDAREKIEAQIAELHPADVAAAAQRVAYFSTIEEAVEGADLVQENGPERPELKQALFADLERLSSSECLLVSSSSGLPPDVIGATMKAPERALIGHPFNPPHLLKVVEVCAAVDAPEELVERLMDFYRSAGRVAVRLKKPIPGFVINRLQAAVLHEAIHIVEEGVVDMQGLDELVMNSLGVRWASIGPFLTGQLGGGAGGLRGIVENILSSLFDGMGLSRTSDETLAMLDGQAGRIYPMKQIGDFAAVRDDRQREILKVQKRNPLPTSD